ncbi:DUF1552 domain-containing protein [Sorangium sp. So ce381]|uniref:DUF1552 domain-containing protein n=1 Tax=Sorangium sp. So ce381 TaxID=3133307 RepID=UPI003F5C4A1D
MNQARFSRRALLQALGVGAAMLPLLHAERAATAAPSAFPKRMIAVTWTNGIFQQNWLPGNDDLNAARLPTILEPLESWKSKVLIPQGVDLKVMLDANRTYDGHFSYGALFTGVSPAPGVSDGVAPSIDQIIGDDLRSKGVSSPQLNLGCRPYGFSTSWAGRNQKNNAETDPYRLFNRLFGGASLPAAQIDKLRKRRQSVLDLVGTDLERFGQRLGTEDRLKVQAHLDSIRALELDLEAAASQRACTPPTIGEGGINYDNINDYPKHVDLMMKLAAAAVKCDLARTVTLDLIDDGGGNSLTFPWLGIGSPDYHAIAHEGANNAAQKTAIDRWFYEQVATLVAQLADSSEGDGSALDNSVVVVANDMNEGNYHAVDNIPFLLVGSCGGFFKTGRKVKLGSMPHNKLLATLCHAMDVPVSSVGDGYGGDCDAFLKA